MSIIASITLSCGPGCYIDVCVLAQCGFASQTQFSNSSVSLHYSYTSEPEDSVTLREYSWYIKVPFAALTGNTHSDCR